MVYNEGHDLSWRVIGLAIEVHHQLGPGLLERVYVECLCYELRQAAIPFLRQTRLPLCYKAVELNCGFLIDLVVDNSLIVEIKAVDQILPVHDAQLLTYLRLSSIPLGLLMNFNSVVLKDGIRRRRI